MAYLIECVVTMPKLFVNDVGRLRSGWRLLIFTLPFLFLTTVWAIVVQQARVLTNASGWHIPRRDFVFESIFRTGLLVIAIGLGYVCARALEELPWRSLGLRARQFWKAGRVGGAVAAPDAHRSARAVDQERHHAGDE